MKKLLFSKLGLGLLLLSPMILIIITAFIQEPVILLILLFVGATLTGIGLIINWIVERDLL